MHISERKTSLYWLSFVLMLLVALPTPAQTLSGSISGTVVDQSDATTGTHD